MGFAVLSASSVSEQHPALNLITSLRNVLREQASAYDVSPRRYALLDFPNFPNVGDSAIWLGELAHFDAVLGSAPAFVCTHDNFSPDTLRKALPSGPIFLSGGGNFGDLWPDHHRFRETVIEQFPDRRIIQLPQTIYFTDPKLIEKTASIIKGHPAFLLFVRDKCSLERARSYFDCPVYLAPDMAFCIGIIPRSVPATHKLLLLLRTDKESARSESLHQNLPEGAIVTDWLEDDPSLFGRLKRRTVLLSPLRRRELLFQSLARDRVSRGVKLLSSAEFIITDRLHCHIFCILLGIPHIVLDNSYGKLSSFIETWTKDNPLVYVAPSLDRAIELWSQVA